MSRRRAFTVIELLVVIGIIFLLIALLMPALSKARESANAVTCSSHVKNLTNAFLLFANDHGGHLPGSRQTWLLNDPNPDHYDWLFGQYAYWDAYGSNTMFDRLKTAPQSGTLWKYVNDPNMYLCPSLILGNQGTSMGTNGRYDYAAFAVWCGASLHSIKAISQLHYPAIKPWPAINLANPGAKADPMSAVYIADNFSSVVDNLPTPIVCQEEAGYSINSGSAFSHNSWDGSLMDGQHDGWEQMAHCHGGGSYYGAIDGSVGFLIEPDISPTDTVNGPNFYKCGANLWWQKGPASSIPTPLTQDLGWNGWASK